MTTPTLILHSRYDTDSQLLWQAAIARDWPVERIKSYLVSAVRELRLPQPEPEELVVYGGYMWAEAVAQTLGVQLQQPPDDWLVHAPAGLKRRHVELRRVREITTFPVFVKSLRGKSLESRVYYSGEDFPPRSEDEEVLVQDVVWWEREYRVFVIDQQPRAVSRYAWDHELSVMPVALDSANAPLNNAVDFVRSVGDLLPLGALAVDVGLVGGKGWAVVELNAAWCSALYACDPSAVLDVVAASCGVRVEGVVR